MQGSRTSTRSTVEAKGEDTLGHACVRVCVCVCVCVLVSRGR